MSASKKPKSKSASKFLTAEQILAADDLASEVVEVPEWSGKVLVRELTGTARDQYQTSLIQMPDKVSKKGGGMTFRLENASVRLVALSIWDEAAAAPLFELSAVAALGMLSGRALNRVYQVAQRLSNLSDEDVEELVGNSEGTPSAGSSSD